MSAYSFACHQECKISEGYPPTKGLESSYLPGFILIYGNYYGIIYGMSAIKKITVHIPEDLIKRAQKSTGQGITETIRQGLKIISASDSYEKLRKLRGKVKLDLDIKKLREDRE